MIGGHKGDERGDWINWEGFIAFPSFHWIGHWMREQILEKKVGEGSVRLELELENVGMDGNILFGQNLGPKMKCF